MKQIGEEFVETPEETVKTQAISALRAAEAAREKEIKWFCQQCGRIDTAPNTVTRRHCSICNRYMVHK